MNPLTLLQNLVVEHGSASIQKKHIDFLKDQIEGLQRRIAELESENAKLLQHLGKPQISQPSQELVFKQGLYWREGDEAPYCPGCYDGQRKAIRLAKQKSPWDQLGEFLCPICKQHFNKD